MKHLLPLLLLFPIAATLHAQDEVSIDGIIKEKKRVSNTTNSTEHFASVWRPRSYFDFIYTRNATLTPADLGQFNGFTGPNTPSAKYNADWGYAIKNGRSFFLHRRAIGRVAYIGLDYTWIDLMANHYKATLDDLGHSFNSSEQLPGGGKAFPVNAQKYEINYGMTLGPSVTLAPFVYIEGAKGLHHLKFNAYYHIGYGVGLLYCNGSAEQNVATTSDNSILFGHGLKSAYGASINWRKVGVGFEVHKAALKHKNDTGGLFNTNNDINVSKIYDFDTSGQRLFLQFRF